MDKEFVYLDYSATTPTDPRVVSVMQPYWTKLFGNASSMHDAGKAAADALSNARETVAGVLNCAAAEVIFTSGGTESNNLALKGIAYAARARGRGNHIITTSVEHHAVLDVVHELAQEGFDVTILPVNEYGQVTPEQVIEALTDATILVSIIYANNEVGSVNPIAEIGKALKPHRVYFHTDAVQAPGLLELDVKVLNVHSMSISAHKFYGPKGVGVLYGKRALPLKAQIVGGGQENHRRSGTESVPLAVGLATALRLAEDERSQTVRKLVSMRGNLIARILEIVPEAQLTGHPQERLPGHTSFALKGFNGDSILLDLNEVGFGASGGSACTTGQQEPSHVLTAMQIDPDRLVGQLRIVVGRHTTTEQIERFLFHFRSIVERHRALIPGM